MYLLFHSNKFLYYFSNKNKQLYITININDELSVRVNSFNDDLVNLIKNIKIINCYLIYLVIILQWHYAY